MNTRLDSDMAPPSPIHPNPWLQTSDTCSPGDPKAFVHINAQGSDDYVIQIEDTEWRPGHHFQTPDDDTAAIGPVAEPANSPRRRQFNMESGRPVNEEQAAGFPVVATAGSAIAIPSNHAQANDAAPLLDIASMVPNSALFSSWIPHDDSITTFQPSFTSVASEQQISSPQAPHETAKVSEDHCGDSEDGNSTGLTTAQSMETDSEPSQTRSQTLDSCTSVSSDGIMSAIDELENEITFHDLMQTMGLPVLEETDLDGIPESPHELLFNAASADGHGAAVDSIPKQNADCCEGSMTDGERKTEQGTLSLFKFQGR